MTIIIPPPEVRAVADRAAAYVAKNGREFEERLYLENKHNPKFSFINQNDPYHAYFQKKIQDLNQGGTVAIAQALVEATEILNRERLAHDKISSCIPPSAIPDTLEFILNVPLISPSDLDVMKLAAQFAALKGRGFILQISQREYKNPQFEFLKAGHHLYKVFNRLVDQYQKILGINTTKSDVNTGDDDDDSNNIATAAGIMNSNLQKILDRLQENREQTFERIKLRAEYNRWLKKQQAHEEEAAEKEKKAFAAIDWHDNEIVDTIDFGPADKTKELPPPISLEIISQMTLEQKQNLVADRLDRSLLAGSVAGISASGITVNATTFGSSSSSSTIINTRKSLPSPMNNDDDEMELDDNIKPPANKKSLLSKSDNDILVQCEICKLEFPSSQIQEHMRKEMLDEKWIKQKKANIFKHVESNIVTSGNEVLENLKKQKL